MAKKFRKINPNRLVAQIRAVSTKLISEEGKVHRDEHPLSHTDKLVWVYKEVKEKNKIQITEIVTVSFVTEINDKEYTVVYYDNTHDKTLHQHIYNSIFDNSDSIVPLSVRKKGNQKKLLNWAIKDIRNNWQKYRNEYYRRSKLTPDF